MIESRLAPLDLLVEGFQGVRDPQADQVAADALDRCLRKNLALHEAAARRLPTAP